MGKMKDRGHFAKGDANLSSFVLEIVKPQNELFSLADRVHDHICSHTDTEVKSEAFARSNE